MIDYVGLVCFVRMILGINYTSKDKVFLVVIVPCMSMA